MKKDSNQLVFRLLLVIAMIVASLIVYPKLPDTVPTHWNFSGEPDQYGSKFWGSFLMPGLALIFVFLFPVLAKIDPRHRNYAKFKTAWEVIQTVIIAIFAYFYFIFLYLTVNIEKSYLLPSFMFGGLGVMFVLLGYYMMQVRQNYFVGLKTPWTLDDSEVWDKSHKFTGKIFILAGLLFLVEAWFRIFIWQVFLFIVIASVLVPFLHSYFIWRKRHGQK